MTIAYLDTFLGNILNFELGDFHSNSICLYPCYLEHEAKWPPTLTATHLFTKLYFPSELTSFAFQIGLFHCFTRLPYFLIQVSVPSFLSYIEIRNPWSYLVIISIGDAVTIPLIIQLSYLRCNVNEVITLFRSFNLGKFLKILFGGVDNCVRSTTAPVAFSIT